MIDELRELFAKLYAAGCEHDNYAYALSDELNAEVDKALLKAFRNDLENLVSRCEIVSKTEKYAVDHMKGYMPARRFSWKKFRRVPNKAAEAIDDVLQKGEPFFAQGAAGQTAAIGLLIRMAQSGEREEPEGEPLEEDAAEPAETPRDAPQEAEPEEESKAPQERRKTPRRKEKKPGRRKDPKGEAENAGKPESGNEGAAELWDEAEADEDEAPGAVE